MPYLLAPDLEMDIRSLTTAIEKLNITLAGGMYAEGLSNIEIVEEHIPLTNKSYEATLLGGLMLDNSAFNVIKERVAVCHFETHRHRNIFGAMERVHAKDGQGIDTLKVYDELGRLGQADENMEQYLFDLAKNTPAASIAHLPAIANIVMVNSHEREKK